MTMKLNDITSFSGEAFELIWDNTNDAIFTIGQDGSILHANPTFTDILGWKIEEIKGLNPPPIFVNYSRGDHQAQLEKLKRGENVNYSVTNRRSKNGEILEILATYRAINKGEILAVGMYKDFTEQMEIQRKLEASEDCYRKLVEFLPDAIIVQNKHHIVFANPAGAKLLGQDNVKDIIGKPIWKFIYSDNRNQIEKLMIDLLEKRKNNTPDPVIEKIMRFDYKLFYVEITAIPIVYDGESVIQLLFRDISDRKKYEMELEYLAYHDPLTGLKNRRSFIEYTERSIQEAIDSGEQLALMYIDLDKFKEVNDSLGHEIGDELLKQFGKRLFEHVKEGSIHSRIGGDEFLILIREVKNKDFVLNIAERLHLELQKPFQISGHTLNNKASIGISMFPHDATNRKQLIRNSDQALYLAKEDRNDYKFYS